MVKVLSDTATDRILGVHIVGAVSQLGTLQCYEESALVCGYAGSR